ncbi:PAS domain-containing protein [Lichenicoccus roseus]|uniref:Photoactive yellow protein n=1 Tax=Lichenicoccus roseus TaxID=2683649 RepID=A0A5R9JB44_9PROT|nr:PAS domain-containing protein [Lichenicoccus roseus]TLU71458.1 PAS domain-containing protein [Lichenicoccus roseus]
MTQTVAEPDVSPGRQETNSRDLPGPFAAPDLFDWLIVAAASDLDTLPYGVIAMDLDGVVLAYNSAESKYAGLGVERVLGRNFFSNVAPCMNNFMVAHRFQTEVDLDVIIDYVLTLRMKPQKVQLRLLKRSDVSRMYLIVQRRT